MMVFPGASALVALALLLVCRSATAAASARLPRARSAVRTAEQMQADAQFHLAIAAAAYGAVGTNGGAKAAPLSSAPVSGCGVVFANATYDLSPLNRGPSTFYSLTDQSGRDFRYLFNVCQGVQLPPYFPAPCNATLPAFQVLDNSTTHTRKCHALASSADPAAITWGLLDRTDPSSGVSMTYSGGDACTVRPGVTARRSFTLNLYCSPHLDFASLQHAQVWESDCAYALSAFSVYACPTQCPITSSTAGGFALCGGHGICAFDTDAKAPRCFCSDAYTGADCTTPYSAASGGDSGIGLMGVFLVLLVIVLFGLDMAAVLFYLRIRTFKPQRELSQMDAEHMTAIGASGMPDDGGPVGADAGVGGVSGISGISGSINDEHVPSRPGVFTIE